MSDEFVEPTRDGRRHLLWLLMLGILAGALLQFWLKPAFLSYVKSLPSCEQFKWLRIWLVSALCSPGLLALWGIVHSIRLLKSKQSPLPGAWVWRRTPVKRGEVVRLRAFALLFLSAVAIAVPVVGWHWITSTALFTPSRSCA